VQGPKSEFQSLRVLHVAEAFGGGVLKMASTLASRMAEGGDETAIAFGRRPETPVDLTEHLSPRVQLHELPWGERSLRGHLRAARLLRTLAHDWEPDVVHLHSSFAGVVGSLALPRRTPSIYTPHGYSFTMQDQSRARRVGFRGLERITSRKVSAVGAVSEAEAALAREVAAEGKVVAVGNGVPELDGLSPDGPIPAPSAPPRVITLGRITAQHIPDSTARILSSVSDVASVEWVGGGGRGDVPVSVVTGRGVPVTGWVEQQRASELLRAATVCLHWTAWDGLPLAILEALANDVVVVARDIPPTREILGPQQVCGTEEQAVALIETILRDNAFREELLLEQRSRRGRYSAEQMVAAWRRLYERLTAGGSAATGT
jgi:glycosyltransferase involved in cell wall biosynthesis